MCATAMDADAVLLTTDSARRVLPGWSWRALAEPALELVTWLVWPPTTRSVVQRVADVISGLAEAEQARVPIQQAKTPGVHRDD
jgi:hypothetical protein